jgi:hypothetical protein
MTWRERSKDDEIPNLLTSLPKKKLILSENEEEKTKFRARPTVLI